MFSVNGPQFSHWLNLDGSYDSICLGCIVTIASAQTEAELAIPESRHMCDRDAQERGGVAA
jgi:hypothetical protein